MKRLLVIPILIILLISSHENFAQQNLTKKEKRKEEKAKRKEQKNHDLKENKSNYLKIIKDSTIVIEVDYYTLNKNIKKQTFSGNFIKINKKEIVVQTSSPGHIFSNGMGGKTITGKIQSYKIIEGNDKGPIKVVIQFFSRQHLRYYNLVLNVHSTTFSSGYLTDNSGNILKFEGKAYTLEKNIIFNANNDLLVD